MLGFGFDTMVMITKISRGQQNIGLRQEQYVAWGLNGIWMFIPHSGADRGSHCAFFDLIWSICIASFSSRDPQANIG